VARSTQSEPVVTTHADGFDRRAPIGPAGRERTMEVRSADLHELVTISRITRVGRVALTIAVVAAAAGVAFAVAAVAAPVAVLWGTGAILVVLLTATGLLSAHAGGHAWFVPIPAFSLAVVWALSASIGSPRGDWWLVALSATASAGSIVLATTALRQRLRGELALLPHLRGATGVAVTDLTPVGVVQVGGETWSAESVSGPLPAGAPVHALNARGVRLEVWSEAGTVADANVLDIKEGQP
jgi:membrane-bound ClpP family serine protease